MTRNATRMPVLPPEMKRLPFLAFAVLLALGPYFPARAGWQYGDQGRDADADQDAVESDGDGGDQDVREPVPDDYESSLSPYGYWVDDPGYGRVWRPQVAVGWQPYVDGSWAWTRWGWTWVSAGPWAWTFHYGRWAWLPVGWVWVPGSVWGPAWVDWSWGDGFVAWAPLAPFGVVGVDRYVFVDERHFCHRHLDRVIVREREVPHLVREGVEHRSHARSPDREQITRVTADPVQQVDGRPHDSIAPWGRRAGRRDAERDRAEHDGRNDGRHDGRSGAASDRRDDDRGTGWQHGHRRADDAPPTATFPAPRPPVADRPSDGGNVLTPPAQPPPARSGGGRGFSQQRSGSRGSRPAPLPSPSQTGDGGQPGASAPLPPPPRAPEGHRIGGRGESPGRQRARRTPAQPSP